MNGEGDGKIFCPWCPKGSGKRVRLRTNGTLYRHAPYGKGYSGAQAEPCAGSGRNPKEKAEEKLRAAERAARTETS